MSDARAQMIAAEYEDALAEGDVAAAQRIRSQAYDDDAAQALMKSIDRKYPVKQDEPLMKRADQGHQGGHQ